MHIRLLTIGNKMPSWVNEGFQEYAKRFPPTCMLELIEIPAEKRSKTSDTLRLIKKEGEKLIAFFKPDNRIISLDSRGKLFTTEQLAELLKKWLQAGKNIDLLIGGADGLAEECIKKSEFSWSLSPLTFPHPLVRVVLAEQLYRALMIIQGHPYHRA